MPVPIRSSVLLVAVTLLATGRVSAQSAQAVSLQVSGLYNVVFGNVFENLKNGLGGEAQIRYTPGALSYGLGFQYTAHDRPPVSLGDSPLDARGGNNQSGKKYWKNKKKSQKE